MEKPQLEVYPEVLTIKPKYKEIRFSFDSLKLKNCTNDSCIGFKFEIPSNTEDQIEIDPIISYIPPQRSRHIAVFWKNRDVTEEVNLEIILKHSVIEKSQFNSEWDTTIQSPQIKIIRVIISPAFEQMYSFEYLLDQIAKDNVDTLLELNGVELMRKIYKSDPSLFPILEKYKELAKTEDAGAMCVLGYLYKEGWIVEKDIEEANQWLKKSAQKGNLFALLYAVRSLADSNNKEFPEILRKNAERSGFATSAAISMFPEHLDELIKKMIPQGPPSYYFLGSYHLMCRNMPQAIFWFTKASESQYQIGELARKGLDDIFNAFEKKEYLQWSVYRFVDTHNKELESSKKKLIEQIHRKEEAEKRESTLKSVLEKNKDENNKVEEEKKKLSTENQKLTEDREKLDKEKAAIADERQKLRDERTALEKNNLLSKEEIEAKRASIDEREARLNAKEKELIDRESKFNEKKKKYHEEQQKNDEKLKKVLEEKNELQGKIPFSNNSIELVKKNEKIKNELMSEAERERKNADKFYKIYIDADKRATEAEKRLHDSQDFVSKTLAVLATKSPIVKVFAKNAEELKIEGNVENLHADVLHKH